VDVAAKREFMSRLGYRIVVICSQTALHVLKWSVIRCTTDARAAWRATVFVLAAMCFTVTTQRILYETHIS
jgi:hypothetical protein